MAIIEMNQVTRDFTLHAGHGVVRQRTLKRAVDGLTMSIEPGEAVGFIGANGSGKSTTIKMLTGILTPTSGSLRVCGFNPVPQRKKLAAHLGVLFGQRSLLWWDLPLEESFPVLGAMHRQAKSRWQPRLDELVDGLDLASFMATPVRNLSLGQRMRGELAAALLHQPELIVLDEPTIGLDMLSKERLRTYLQREISEHGTTLLLTTHDMGDVQRLCERMIIVDHGHLVFDGSQSDLAAQAGAERVLVIDTVSENVESLQLPREAHLIDVDGPRVRVGFAPDSLTAAALLAHVSTQVDVLDISLSEPDIEDLVKRIYLREKRTETGISLNN